MLGEVLCFKGTFMAKLITFIRALFNCCTSYGYISCFYFLLIYALFIWELRMSMLLLCFILAHHTINSDFNRGKKKKKIKFVIVIVCLSRVLAKVMKMCAIKVWLEFIYFWPILLCQCVCRDDRSMHKGPVRFANMKIKHNDNKNGEE